MASFCQGLLRNVGVTSFTKSSATIRTRPSNYIAQGKLVRSSKIPMGKVGQWTNVKIEMCTQRRFISTSSALLLRPRKSSHIGPTGSDELEADDGYQGVLERQRERAMERENVPSQSNQEETAPSKDAQRKELIAKLIERHVPVSDPDQSLVVFNKIIGGFVRKNMIEEAKETFNQMMALDIVANRETLNILVSGYASKPHIEDLQSVMDLMAGTIGLDVFTFNALISSFAKLGKSCNAKEMFYLMRQHNVTEDISTCNLLLSTYPRVVSEDPMEKAESLLEWMRQNGHRPDQTTYNSLIACCGSNIERALDFYEASISAAKAGEISAEPDEMRLSKMIQAFAKAKELQAGLDFVEQFQQQYPRFFMSHGNHGALFQLSISSLHFKDAFDDLDIYLSSLENIDDATGISSPIIPTVLGLDVIASLRTLPEAVITENATHLDEWKQLLQTAPFLKTSDAVDFKRALLRWREVYIPVAGRNLEPETEI